jgi:site-specific DNA recombinase
MKAAIYLRVSTEDQARKGYSLDEQELQCRQYARESGADDAEVFRDEGLSGGLLERPGLTVLRAAVKTGAFSLVVVKDPDRLSRELVHQLIVTEELERHARLAFVNFDRDATPEGQMFFQMRGVIAQFEKAKISQRMADGRRQKARQGQVPIGSAAYGYSYDKEKDMLVVVEAEAAVVRRMFDMLVNQGMGPQVIARKLTEEGVPTKKGAAHWYRAVIRNMLANPVYKGTFYYGRKDWRNTYLNKHKPSGQKLTATPRPEEEWVAVDVPAIVDAETWYSANVYLADAKRIWRGTQKNEYLLSGLVRCGRCGQTMPGITPHMRTTPLKYYTCHKTGLDASHPGCRHWARGKELEEAVWKAAIAYIGNTDTSPPPADFTTELSEIANLEKESLEARRRLIGALEKGLVAESDLADNLQRIADRLASLRKRRTVIENASAEATAWESRTSSVRQMVAEHSTENMPFAKRQQLVRILFREILVYPSGNITVAHREPGQSHQVLQSETKTVFLTLTYKPPARRTAN